MKRIVLGAVALLPLGMASAAPLPKFYVDAHVWNKQDLPIQVTLDALPFRPLKKGEQAWFREEASSGTHSIRIIGPDNKTSKVYVQMGFGHEVSGYGNIYAYCVDITKYDAAANPPWTAAVNPPGLCGERIPKPPAPTAAATPPKPAKH
ncbi:MAG: hypothetical protein JO348_11995 [Alphaproteobacteria bacterium]|nr:hypothetical protein [Alphaproteobacteria bacterium]MBV9420485.1 hypothetical protein [Alphaproteobacteria bacterium]